MVAEAGYLDTHLLAGLNEGPALLHLHRLAVDLKLDHLRMLWVELLPKVDATIPGEGLWDHGEALLVEHHLGRSGLGLPR